jgi:hypothetical protein
MLPRLPSRPRACVLPGLLSAAVGCAAPSNTDDPTQDAAGGLTTASAPSTSESESSDGTAGATQPDTSTGDDDGIKFDAGAGEDGETGVQGDCDPDLIPDTVGFSFVASYDLGIDTLQAGLYDSTRQRVVVFSFYGEGRILGTDGSPLGEAMAPPEALPSLDGGAFDAAADLILLINQGCDIVEVDPVTFEAVSVTPIGLTHQVSVCAGLAIDPMSNLYVTSYGTDELVVLDRTGAVELFRVDMLAIGMAGFDGIAEIAGSDNFLVNSTTQLTAAIIAADGTLVAGPGPVGEMPIMGGGAVGQPDAMLTICENGNTWVCDAYETTCSDFAPTDGDKMACGCLVAG